MSEERQLSLAVVVDPQPPDPPAAAEVTPELPTVRPLVDGRPFGGSGRRLTLANPATGEPAVVLATAGPEDVAQAVEAASFTAALWRGTPFQERRERLRKLAELVRKEQRAIARLIAREQGKPYVEALTLEVLPALDHLRFIVRNAQRYHAGISLDSRHALYAHKRAHYLYDPVGVVALITSASHPFALPLVQVASALAMGNAVVLKPSERTPLCGLRVGELCLEAGVPPGLVNVVPALPEDTLRLAAHPKVDKVFFTGKLEGGRQVMATAGCAPRPVVLSLGGKHASVVAGDADVERAARGVVWGALANAGQNCGSIERVYVEERIAGRFLERLLALVDEIVMGDPLVERVDLGPLVSEDRRREVHEQVREAVAAGGRLLRGGEMPQRPGWFYPPTVVLGAPEDSRLMREETLGPVIALSVVESLERAVLLANESDYALSASGWTGSAENADRLMVGLQAGVVTINDVLYAYGEPAATWAGFRKSGIGQNHGTAGLREMCRQRFVSYDERPAQAPLFAYPYDIDATSLAHAALDHLHGHRWFRRFAGLLRLARLKRFRRRVPLRAFLSAKREPGN